MLRTILLVPFCLLTICSFAQNGLKINLSLENYAEPQIYLAEQFGEDQYIKDSTAINTEGEYVFSLSNNLESGVYFLVLPPENKLIHFLIDGQTDQIFFSSHADYLISEMKVTNDPVNKSYYDYLQFLGSNQIISNKYKAERETAVAAKDQENLMELSEKIFQIDESVRQYQQELINKDSNSLLAKIVRANQPIFIPDFSDQPDPDFSNFLYTKKHWFDLVDFNDPRIIRTSILGEKIDGYLERLTYPFADSLNQSIDFILGKFEKNPIAYEYYLIRFLNKFASSSRVGMDAVYVHLAENYFAKGKANFTEESQRNKIVSDAEKMKPTLIGKIAPDIALQEIDWEATLKAKDKKNEHKRFVSKRSFSLHEIKADYTVLFMWSPTCNHCKESMPELKVFYEKYKDKNIELVALCNQSHKGIPLCAETIQDKEIFTWVNAMDPYLKSRFKQLYNVRNYPLILVLDKDKKILIKQIGAEQLDGVMTAILNGEEF